MTYDTAKLITKWLIAATFVIWIGWDVYASVGFEAGATESEVVKRYSYKQPWFTFAMGILMAHFFINRNVRLQWWRPLLLMPLSIGLIALAHHVFGWIGPANPAYYFLPGLAWGAYVWPQSERYRYP